MAMIIESTKRKMTLVFSLLIFHQILSSTHSLAIQNYNNDQARIKCDYRQNIDGDSLVLNCTLLTGSSISNGRLPNQINDGGSGKGTSVGPAGSNIRIGIEKAWRTPWESISINHNIIRTLIWAHSRLSELGEFAFKDLNYVQKIDLSFNKLQTLNGYSFNNFELDVLELDLSHNLFHSVPVDLFMNKRLQKLEELRMNENPIAYLQRKPFEFIRSSIKVIELNYCHIKSIDLNTFDDMKQLESVSLIGNHLRSLKEYTFRDLSLRSFYVHENPLVCDCHMRWLINYLKNVDYQQQAYESQNTVGFYEQSSKPKSKYLPKKTVADAAQTLLKCDQPNSLKAKQRFLDINPDSFMCDVEIQFRNEVTDSNYELGDDALLICDVYGDPEPVVYWSFGNRPIEKALNNDVDKYYVHEIRSPLYASSFKNSLNAGSSSQSTNKTSELRIKNLEASDFGVYACTAEIAGSNNRKQITFTLRQSGDSGLAGAGGLVVGGVSMLAAATSSLFNKPLSNWTLLLLLAIVVSLIIFIMMLSSFICWKCRRRKIETKQFEQQTLRRKEQEKLLNSDTLNGRKLLKQNIHHEEIYGNSKLMDHLDCTTNHHQLSNDSSATLISSNKMTNSIRMAYPNSNTINSNVNHGMVPHQSDIYANHSLLTTTSTTTGSYLANGAHNPAIAIDTSNNTPRLQMMNQQQQQNGMDSYYDDLRYNDEHIAQLQLQAHQSNQFPSPYKQSSGPQSTYSPLVRREDPTVPLYATLKPKQHQRQYTSNYITSSTNYVPYSTIQRSTLSSNTNTPQLPNSHRSGSNQNNYQVLPPPPPPPPTKPKRTFEYGASGNDLHSESGAFLLANDYNGQQEMISEQIYSTHLKNKNKSLRKQDEGSATSLDEEDLDLNDLKDFEDVTFDNLRRPEQQRKLSTKVLPPSNRTLKKRIPKVLIGENNNTSDQSLLLKSSESSSDNTINNVPMTLTPNDLETSKNLNDVNSNNTQTTAVDASSNNTDLNIEEEIQEKIYEETEI